MDSAPRCHGLLLALLCLTSIGAFAEGCSCVPDAEMQQQLADKNYLLVCDPRCLSTDPFEGFACNFFGLGQECRGCSADNCTGPLSEGVVGCVPCGDLATTARPTAAPASPGPTSAAPTAVPTSSSLPRTSAPSVARTAAPTSVFTTAPTAFATPRPTQRPEKTASPTGSSSPTTTGTGMPTAAPSTTTVPQQSAAPTVSPANAPPTAAQTLEPSRARSAVPTPSPSPASTAATSQPTAAPPKAKTKAPVVTQQPSEAPTMPEPSTAAPSSAKPTAAPAALGGTPAPSASGSGAETVAPTLQGAKGTPRPTAAPTSSPTPAPTSSGETLITAGDFQAGCTSGSSPQFFLQRVDSAGNVVQTSVNSITAGCPTDMTLDASGNPVIVGYLVDGRRRGRRRLLQAGVMGTAGFVLYADATTLEQLCDFNWGNTMHGLPLHVSLPAAVSADSFYVDLSLQDGFNLRLNLYDASVCGELASEIASAAIATPQLDNVGTVMGVAVTAMVLTALAAAAAGTVVLPRVLGVPHVSFGVGGHEHGRRAPSTTLSIQAVALLQFLALAGLAANGDSGGAGVFYAFSRRLWWSNLWASLWWDMENSADGCGGPDAPGLSTKVALGNAMLVFILLPAIYLVHLLTAAYFEGRWLARNVAAERINRAATAGPTKSFEVTEKTRRVKTRHLLPAAIERMRRVWKAGESVLPHPPNIELVFVLLAFTGAVTADFSLVGRGCSRWSVALGAFFFVALPCKVLLFVIHFLMAGIYTRWAQLDYIPDDSSVLIFIKRRNKSLKAVDMPDSGAGTPADMNTPIDITPGGPKSTGSFSSATGARGRNWEAFSEEDFTPQPLTWSQRVNNSVSRVADGVRDSLNGRRDSVFSWANRGKWRMRRNAKGDKMEQTWWRVGLAPLFQDFTRDGAAYTFYSLGLALAAGIVVGLESHSSRALATLLCLGAVDCGVLLLMRPFINCAVNNVVTAVSLLKAVMLVLLLLATVKPAKAAHLNLAVVVVGTFAVLLLCFPVYADLIVRVQRALAARRKAAAMAQTTIPSRLNSNFQLEEKDDEDIGDDIQVTRQELLVCFLAAVRANLGFTGRVFRKTLLARALPKRLRKTAPEDEPPSARSLTVQAATSLTSSAPLQKAKSVSSAAPAHGSGSGAFLAAKNERLTQAWRQQSLPAMLYGPGRLAGSANLAATVEELGGGEAGAAGEVRPRDWGDMVEWSKQMSASDASPRLHDDQEEETKEELSSSGDGSLSSGEGEGGRLHERPGGSVRWRDEMAEDSEFSV